MTSTTTTTSATTSSAGDVDLSSAAGYDDEQIRLMEEVCIVIDENDQPLRPGTKKECTLPESLFFFLLVSPASTIFARVF
jgi:isopentenyl-diphosphate delta-isomerase